MALPILDWILHHETTVNIMPESYRFKGRVEHIYFNRTADKRQVEGAMENILIMARNFGALFLRIIIPILTANCVYDFLKRGIEIEQTINISGNKLHTSIAPHAGVVLLQWWMSVSFVTLLLYNKITRAVMCSSGRRCSEIFIK